MKTFILAIIGIVLVGNISAASLSNAKSSGNIPECLDLLECVKLFPKNLAAKILKILIPPPPPPISIPGSKDRCKECTTLNQIKILVKLRCMRNTSDTTLLKPIKCIAEKISCTKPGLDKILPSNYSKTFDCLRDILLTGLDMMKCDQLSNVFGIFISFVNGKVDPTSVEQLIKNLKEANKKFKCINDLKN